MTSAVNTYGLCSASRIAVENTWKKIAPTGKASVIAGSTTPSDERAPDAGNQPSVNENTLIRMSPVTNAGTATPSGGSCTSRSRSHFHGEM